MPSAFPCHVMLHDETESCPKPHILSRAGHSVAVMLHPSLSHVTSLLRRPHTMDTAENHVTPVTGATMLLVATNNQCLDALSKANAPKEATQGLLHRMPQGPGRPVCRAGPQTAVKQQQLHHHRHSPAHGQPRACWLRCPCLPASAYHALRLIQSQHSLVPGQSPSLLPKRHKAWHSRPLQAGSPPPLGLLARHVKDWQPPPSSPPKLQPELRSAQF